MLFPGIPERYRDQFPDFFWDWWRDLKRFITTEFTTTGSITLLTASAGIILVSPDGTKYKVTVNDAGALVITAV